MVVLQPHFDFLKISIHPFYVVFNGLDRLLHAAKLCAFFLQRTEEFFHLLTKKKSEITIDEEAASLRFTEAQQDICDTQTQPWASHPTPRERRGNFIQPQTWVGFNGGLMADSKRYSDRPYCTNYIRHFLIIWWLRHKVHKAQEKYTSQGRELTMFSQPRALCSETRESHGPHGRRSHTPGGTKTHPRGPCTVRVHSGLKWRSRTSLWSFILYLT